MRNYNDYKEDKKRDELTKEELAKVEWVKYKIIVPSQEEKEELMDAFKHIHYADIDTDYVGVNQLAHEYHDDDNNIIVDKDLYDQLNKK